MKSLLWPCPQIFREYPKPELRALQTSSFSQVSISPREADICSLEVSYHSENSSLHMAIGKFISQDCKDKMEEAVSQTVSASPASLL